MVIFKNTMVPMRDSTRLATDIYRPMDAGEALRKPMPVLLCRTPYVKDSTRYVEIADFFVPRGFGVVLQDLRGRGESEGTGQYHHVVNGDEGIDGYDTIEWIAEQAWCNGKIGMVGSSFAAVVQVRAALENPPHLTAIWPDVTPTNSYMHQAREGGAMALHMFWALFLHAQDSQEIRTDLAAQQVVWDGLRDLRTWLRKTPFVAGETPLAVVPNLERILIDYYTRGRFDEFWAQIANDFERHFDAHADVPGTFSGGWFDPFSPAMTGYYAAMRRKNTSPQRLIMGPWTHVGMRSDASYQGDVDFGAESTWGVDAYFEQQLCFFDRLLKGAGNHGTPETSVQIFVMGGGDGRKTDAGKMNHGGRWRDEVEWPLLRTQHTPYYLQTDGMLSLSPPDEENRFRSFTFDPNHPVPTVGGSLTGMMDLSDSDASMDPMWRRYLHPVTRLNDIVVPGPAHQQESPEIYGAQPPYPMLCDRTDVLCFQTPALDGPLEVTGAAIVDLWISSSARDTDFTAKLLDVYPPNEGYPDGYHMILTDSIVRTRFREGWDREVLMKPGGVYKVRIALPPTSNLFASGHRLRLDISSSNFPKFDLNPNTGEPIGRHTSTVSAANVVHVSRNSPSCVTLPVIPAISQ